jgi:hypothetical protein
MLKYWEIKVNTFCASCGKQVGLGSQFCPNCGDELVQNSGAPVASVTPSGGLSRADALHSPGHRARTSGVPTPHVRTGLIVCLAVAVCIGLVWFYASPYLALRHLRQAVLDGNTAFLSEAIDFPAFRASIKDELLSQVSKDPSNGEVKNNSPASLGAVLAGGFIGVMIDQFVTPQTITSMAQGKKVEGVPDGLEDIIERLAMKPGVGMDDSEIRVSTGYESFDRFSARFSPPKSKEAVTLVWVRSGLVNWRLSGIRLPNSHDSTQQTDEAVPSSPRVVDPVPASINGTYKMICNTQNVGDDGKTRNEPRMGTLEVREQSGSKLKFTLQSDLIIDEATGNIHSGEVESEVEIRDGEAVYVVHSDKDDPLSSCKITMKFSVDKVELDQTEPCGFGLGVDASGTYVKVN